jgi:hypothetical protein
MVGAQSRRRGDRYRPKSESTPYWVGYAIVLVVGAALMILAFI